MSATFHYAMGTSGLTSTQSGSSVKVRNEKCANRPAFLSQSFRNRSNEPAQNYLAPVGMAPAMMIIGENTVAGVVVSAGISPAN